jgi:hypothetical protein
MCRPRGIPDVEHLFIVGEIPLSMSSCRIFSKGKSPASFIFLVVLQRVSSDLASSSIYSLYLGDHADDIGPTCTSTLSTSAY